MCSTIVACALLLCQPGEMSVKLTYSGYSLNRNTIPRFLDSWTDPTLDVVVVPVWGSLNFVNSLASAAVTLGGRLGKTVINKARFIIVLEQIGKKLVVAAPIETETDATYLMEQNTSAKFLDLRGMVGNLPEKDSYILAYARSMVFWHTQNQYCGACGNKTQQKKGGHVRYCSSNDCSIEHFPRIDPAVIMLITNESCSESVCLLGRQEKWPAGSYSCLAGFVEPGETVEETVAREVKEEVGIPIFNISYLASQPWPFPSSLMLGFRAQTQTMSLKIDSEELEDARWFTRKEVMAFGPWGHDSEGFKKPRPDSIAHWLITDWLNG